MGATRRRANQLAAAEGEAAREVAADHAEFTKSAAAPGPARSRPPSHQPQPPKQQPWWVGYLTTVALSFAFWSFTRMLLRNQAFLSAHKQHET
jgi:hypothetical protein